MGEGLGKPGNPMPKGIFLGSAGVAHAFVLYMKETKACATPAPPGKVHVEIGSPRAEFPCGAGKNACGAETNPN